MNLEKKDINVFLEMWIRHDPELWSELRPIQIRLLLDRIVREMSYKEIAIVHKVSEEIIRRIFFDIYDRIQRLISPDIAKQLLYLDIKLDERPEKPFMRITYSLN